MNNEHLGGGECRSPLPSPLEAAPEGASIAAVQPRGIPSLALPLARRFRGGLRPCSLGTGRGPGPPAFAAGPPRPDAPVQLRCFGAFRYARARRPPLLRLPPVGPGSAGASPLPSARRRFGASPRRLWRRRRQRPSPPGSAFGACARPPLRRLPPPGPLAPARAAARAGSLRLRSPGWARSPLGCCGLAPVALRAAAGFRCPPGAARLGRGPPSAAPLGLRFACRRGSRRGASGGASPRSSRPPAPRRRGVGSAACGRR